MRFFLLLALCGSLFHCAALAQTTISGRVLDAKSGDGMPGTTILQTGTTNGVSSDTEGNFTLTIPAVRDSVVLTVSSIGYVTQRQQVAAGSISIIRLAPDTRLIECDLVALPRAEIGVSSGLRYAPFGGTLRLYGQRLVHVPLTATMGYQTNFGRNQTVTAILGLPTLWQRNLLTVTESLDYQLLQATAAAIRFRSYTATVGISIYRIGAVRLPTILVGGGYARLGSLAAEPPAAVTGYGYLFGLTSSHLPLNLIGSGQATHWPEYWQWQARLQHYLPGYLLAGITLNCVRSYSEVSLAVSRMF